MNRIKQYKFLTGSVAILAGALVVSGCNNKSAHPDEKAAVTNALSNNSLSDVSVSQDQDKGVMTLTGDVASADQKSQAEALAKQAAPDYSVANEIGVRPTGAEGQAKAVDSNLDSAIEDNYKAIFESQQAPRRSKHRLFCQERNPGSERQRKDRRAEDGSRQAGKGSTQRPAGCE